MFVVDDLYVLFFSLFMYVCVYIYMYTVVQQP